ncbi:Ankyrin repeat-containing domain [Penicillium camemberti]|uniref:Ankyrin repeat-containing domain n=1 Tax=Penicillium camemberti (strain FM 013) TaxID=1429867 RepID=A0A0G4PAW2_PENC3|nr:Ankyrin repeat-containing domain [Penicillium camemberti]
MSQSLSSAPRLKPDVRLAQVVSQFEAELSNEQKASFRAWRTKSIESPPSIQDVMQLTAEIDRVSERRRRCLGPRLMNVLQATQQFAALGDIIVGGSQNLLACGVWSIVRISLLLVLDFSSYLEQLSKIFMTAGRLAPRYEKMALLYPRSKDLQSCLCEYFILIVRLCHEMTSFTRKSIFGKLTSALGDSDLKTYQSELESWGKTIKAEVGFLMAKGIEDEAEHNFRFRAVSSIFQKSTAYQQAIQTKQRVLDFCSQFDCTVSWKQARKSGTTNLFRESPKYQNWKSMPVSSTLVYTGKLGSGKSVLLANIVDDLHIGNELTHVAYFFCRHDVSESLKAREVIGSLARQLLYHISDFTTAAEYLDITHQIEPMERLMGLLSSSLAPLRLSRRFFLVIDGLDELDVHQRDILIQQLSDLQSETLTILLCISLRDDPNENPLKTNFARLAAPVVTAIPNNTPDIEDFIETELESRIESGNLTIGSPLLILEIQDALLQGSQGMFLWVALQIESLCTMESDEEIRQALADLPKDLSATFSRTLRSKSQNTRQKEILAILTVAQTPLTLQQLREALCVVPGDLNWNPDRLLNNMHNTLASCGSLVTIDEEELTIHLVHHSVKQFLLGEFKDSTETLVNVDDAHQMMASIILTYLNYGVFETRVSKTVIPQLETGSVPSEVILSTLKSSTGVRNMAIKLLRSRKGSGFDIGKIIAETKLQNQSTEEQFYFRKYAVSFWLYHAVHAFDLPEAMHRLLLRLLDRRKQYASLIKILLDGTMTSAERDMTLDALHIAAGGGHRSMIQVLLERAKMNDMMMFEGSHPQQLHLSAQNDRVTEPQSLDSNMVDINSRDSLRWTPLHRAAMNGHASTVIFLLTVVNANPTTPDIMGLTPLHLASMNGHFATIEALLDHGNADPHATDNEGRTPGDLALEKLDEETISKLDPRLFGSLGEIIDAASAEGQTC